MLNTKQASCLLNTFDTIVSDNLLNSSVYFVKQKRPEDHTECTKCAIHYKAWLDVLSHFQVKIKHMFK